MRKVPSSRSDICAIDKYVGTGFDAVDVVSKNIEAIEDIAVAADSLKDIGDNIDSIVRLADNLVEHQITETIAIQQGEMVYSFSKVIPTAMELYIHGKAVDKGRLSLEDDYIVESSTSIRLKRTYPVGSKLIAVQTIVAEGNNTVVYDDKTVFNRDVIMFAVGAILKDKSIWTLNLPPLLTYNYVQYYPQQALPIEHTITSNKVTVVDHVKGHIQIETDRGPVVLCPADAMAMPRIEIAEVVRKAIEDALGSPAHQWQPNTRITSPAYQVQVDGISYMPKKVPFDTASTWVDDQVHWYKLAGREPKYINVTGSTLDLTGVEYAVVLSADNPVNVVNIINVPKFHKLLLVPTNTNITLVSTYNIGMTAGSINLSPNNVYEFYSDHTGKLRQVY